MKEYNLEQIIADSYNMILRAQTALEESITQYGIAIDEYANKMVEYRKEKAQVVRSLKAEGMAISIIQDLANGDCAISKGNLLRAEGNVKRLKALINAYQERINGIKHISNKSDMLTK